jgi:hypothetical protein
MNGMRLMAAALSSSLVFTVSSALAGSHLIASYPFNGSADDGSGNGFNGSASGTTNASDRNGQANSAFLFDGIDEFVRVPHDAAFSPPEGIMVEAWIFPTALLEGSEPDDQILVKEFQYQLNINPDTTVSFGIGPDPWTHVYSLQKVRSNQWTHLRGQYEFSTGMLALWVNDSLQGVAYRQMSAWSGGEPLYIGKNPSATSGYYFTGIIDDVHVMAPPHDRYIDANCDGVYDVLDVVQTINAAFRGVSIADLPPCTVAPHQ